ncbi:DUF3332 family protein [Endozoicomonas lisbonensis]|uniref:DUF3332 domain-containing protein n=1 Tax=Endozoicomonas lisbonensis TaxID=3120522 RepID=A0ABV2SDV4_9GAMM
MKKIVIKSTTCAFLGLLLSGCVGSNAVTGKVTEFNIKTVDNRYARAGVNFLLAPVYGISTAADYVVFNALEFWTGKNPINGSPHIFDTETESFIEVNDKIDPNLRDAPIKTSSSHNVIRSSQITEIDENSFEMTFNYESGETTTLKGVKSNDMVSFYMNEELVSITTIERLEDFIGKQA